MRRLPIIARSGGFTLVEVMISMTIVIMLLLVLVSITDSTQRTWTYTVTKVEQFRDAREAFEAITRRLSQATLNTYLDYEYPTVGGVPDTSQPPTGYIRQSELRFISGLAATLLASPNYSTHAIFFQAPTGYVINSANYAGLNKLLNTCGYFIEWGDDSQSRPGFLTSSVVPYRSRFRLMELVEPAESLSLYKYTNGNPGYNLTQWFTDPLALSGTSRPVQARAENILALVILPKLTPQEDPTGTALAPGYTYDSTSTGAAAYLTGTAAAAVNSKNQIPPVVQVTMVALDEASFNRFQRGSSVKPTNLGLENLFSQPGDLVDSNNPGFAQDLKTLTDTLQKNKLHYRVFTTNVSIKTAKWSREQQH